MTCPPRIFVGLVDGSFHVLHCESSSFRTLHFRGASFSAVHFWRSMFVTVHVLLFIILAVHFLPYDAVRFGHVCPVRVFGSGYIKNQEHLTWNGPKITGFPYKDPEIRPPIYRNSHMTQRCSHPGVDRICFLKEHEENSLYTTYSIYFRMVIGLYIYIPFKRTL